MARIVILGSGLTGLSAAYHLEQKGFFDYILFEKESVSGGLCRSVMQDGFTFDYTGHLLHINDEYFKSFIDHVVGFDHFNVIHRRSFVYSQNTFTKFPYQMNLYGLPIDTIVECIEGYVNKPNTKSNRFSTWARNNFGAGFAKHFFYPYQGKIFAYDVNKLTASWTGRFVPQTSLKQIIQGAISEPVDEPIGYNAQFFYPKTGGIMSWVRKIEEQLLNPVRTQYCVRKIDLAQKVVHFTNGHSESYETLINTLPLDTFLRLSRENSSSNLKLALKYLKCNSVVNFNMGINVPNISDKHWVYFPETHYPFYRIGFSHNFSASMAPVGCSSLYGEFAHFKKNREWIDATLAQSLAQTKEWLGIGDADIATQRILEIDHAYVIYDAWRDKNIGKLLSALHAFDVHSIGRYGAWKYASMQEGVLDGKEIAEKIISQNKERKVKVQKTIKKEKVYEHQP